MRVFSPNAVNSFREWGENTINIYVCVMVPLFTGNQTFKLLKEATCLTKNYVCYLVGI